MKLRLGESMDTDRAMELIQDNQRLRHQQSLARRELEVAISALNSVTSFSAENHNVTQAGRALELIQNARGMLLGET